MLSRSLRHNGGGVNPPSSLPTDFRKGKGVEIASRIQLFLDTLLEDFRPGRLGLLRMAAPPHGNIQTKLFAALNLWYFIANDFCAGMFQTFNKIL